MTQDGMLRVSTNVLLKNGSRAVGTRIEPDKPVCQAIRRGEAYHGSAEVVGEMYLTSYEPIVKNGQVVGALFVGVKQHESSLLKETLARIKIGNTGYVYAVDATGKTTSHPKLDAGSDLGKEAFMQTILREKHGALSYNWEGRQKLAVYTEFKPWDWIVVAGGYESEIYASVKKMNQFAWLWLLVNLLVGIVAVYVFIGRAITGIIRSLTGETDRLVQAATPGKLAARGNADGINREFSGIIHGLNATLDAVTAPINEASEVLEQLAGKDLTVRMSGDYQGDFARVKTNLPCLRRIGGHHQSGDGGGGPGHAVRRPGCYRGGQRGKSQPGSRGRCNASGHRLAGANPVCLNSGGEYDAAAAGHRGGGPR
jgi:hypothetical protein